MRLAIIQTEIKDPLGFENLKRWYPRLTADLVVAPELALTGEKLLSEEEWLKRIRCVQDLVSKKGIPLLVGALDPRGPINQALLFTPQKMEVVAEKNNPFPGFDTKIGVKTGTPGYPFRLKGHRIGVVICFDLRFPEITRRLAARGTEIILVLAAWPKERIKHFHTLLAARAIENQVFVCGVNAWGQVAGFDLAGESLLLDPWGREIGKLSGPTAQVFELDCQRLEEARKLFVTSRLTPAPPTERKILDLEKLLEESEARRRLGQKMVFTNGCFDLLHAGHVTYLEEARRAGDFLVVGLNSDASVQKIKGPYRPINPEAHRARVLAALEAVDYIVIFDEETPERLIRALRPEILVKGADWPEEKIVGASFVKSHGGRVLRIPLSFKTSTSQIIARIRQNVSS